MMSVKHIVVAGLFLCESCAALAEDFVGADTIEILNVTVPVEDDHGRVRIDLLNNGEFSDCECVYDAESRLLSKLIFRPALPCGDNSMKELRRMLSSVAELMIPAERDGFIRTDYSALCASNSWGEVIQIVANEHDCLVMISDIAVANRLQLMGCASARFPDRFMQFDFSIRTIITTLDPLLVSVFDGAHTNKYAVYSWDVLTSAPEDSFFDRCRCLLSAKTKSVVSVRLKKSFVAQDQSEVVERFASLVKEFYGDEYVHFIRNPISAEIDGGVCDSCSNGIVFDFRIEPGDMHGERILVADFRLPRLAYRTLISEGKE